MTTGNVHEHLKELLIRIIHAVASWCGIAHVACGQTTWQSEEAERGLESDLSYYFDPEKIRAATEALARESKDPADYPWPDLAAEIESRARRSIGPRSTRPCASPRSGGWSRGGRSSSSSSSRTAPMHRPSRAGSSPSAPTRSSAGSTPRTSARRTPGTAG